MLRVDQGGLEAELGSLRPVHGSRSEQPIQESLLRPGLHAVRTTCRTDYVIRAAVPEAVGHACPHVCAPAHAHAALQHHVLLVCTLKQRFSGVRFSGVRYSRSCASSSSAHARAARASAYAHIEERASSRSAHVRAAAHAHAVRTLALRSSGARYLRSWTRCRRSAGVADPELRGSERGLEWGRESVLARTYRWESQATKGDAAGHRPDPAVGLGKGESRGAEHRHGQ